MEATSNDCRARLRALPGGRDDPLVVDEGWEPEEIERDVLRKAVEFSEREFTRLPAGPLREYCLAGARRMRDLARAWGVPVPPDRERTLREAPREDQ
jgi:tetraacyldisaccharide-1-P 4'-kinase